MEEKKSHFCYSKEIKRAPLPKGRNVQIGRAVWQKSKYWDKGQTLRIHFLEGSDAQINEMKEAIEEILSYTSLEVNYVDDSQNSDIRVSFNEGGGSYSYIGSDALFIPKNEETINIGWRGLDVCRHEFLHACGNLHEQSSSKGGIIWNKEVVYEELGGYPNYWDRGTVDHNVFFKVEDSLVDSSEFDSESIMLYYIPAHWTQNGPFTNNNTELSDTDKEFLGKVYGVTEQDKIAPVITLIGEQSQTVGYGTQYIDMGAKAQDNKDGDISDYIMTEGQIDTFESGLQYITYSVQDNAGNQTEAIRTVLVEEQEEKNGCLGFLFKLFNTEAKLSKLTENQLLVIAKELGIDAAKKDLKKDTLRKVWSEISVKS